MKTNRGRSERFETKIGVRQGIFLSTLLNIIMSEICLEIKTKRKITQQIGI